MSYIISAQRIIIEDKKIKVVRNWLEPKSVKDTQVFLGFTNFYRCFIEYFSKIVASLPLLLKTFSVLSRSQLDKIVNEVNDKIVEGENRGGNIAFVFKKSKNTKFQNLTCA